MSLIYLILSCPRRHRHDGWDEHVVHQFHPQTGVDKVWIKIIYIHIENTSYIFGVAKLSNQTLTHSHSEKPKEAWRFCKYFPYKGIFFENVWRRNIYLKKNNKSPSNILWNFASFPVIFKSMKVADNISRGTLECEWVKQQRLYCQYFWNRVSHFIFYFIFRKIGF